MINMTRRGIRLAKMLLIMIVMITMMMMKILCYDCVLPPPLSLIQRDQSL